MAVDTMDARLKDRLEDTTDRIVYFFGAGISIALAHGGRSWEAWVRDGIARLPDAKRRAEYEAELGDGPGAPAHPSADRLVQVLESLIPELKGHPGVYEAWMHDTFESREVRDEPLADTLRRLLLFQDLFVTTNYDDLLSQATGREPVSYVHPERVYTMADRKRNDLIVHLHGRFSSEAGAEEDSAVATDSQYRDLLANDAAQFVQRVIGTRTVVFVGCGKTTDDANVSRFMRFARDVLKLETTCFFLHREGERPTDLPDNVVPVCYGEEYSDLPKFLSEMATVRADAYLANMPFVELFPGALDDAARRAFSDYHFAAETLTFQGRREELAALDSFLAAGEGMLWYAVTGQAGSGKSRLALELCHRHDADWSSFFIKPYADAGSLGAFEPYRDALVVIDTFKGLEGNVAKLAEGLVDRFEGTPYRLRILFLEREGWSLTGAWFEDLKLAFNTSYLPEFEAHRFGRTDADFLNLGDLADAEIEALIGEIRARNGLPADPVRDRQLREAYWRKFESLRYRPLFVQLFVEATIECGQLDPRYDSYVELLEDVLLREQKRWLQELGIEGPHADHGLFDDWVKLLLLSCVAGRITRDGIPEEYRDSYDRIVDYVRVHSAPGKQRRERFIALISDMCHALEPEESYIEVLYPDLIKEYCLLFYLDEETVVEFAKAVWGLYPMQFCEFLTMIGEDFPFNEITIAAFDGDETYRYSPPALAARTRVFDNATVAGEEDLERRLTIAMSECDFWCEAAGHVDGKDETVSIAVVGGLAKVAGEFGRFYGLLDDAIPMMLGIFDEALDIPGGVATAMVKVYLANEIEQALISANLFDAAQQFQLNVQERLAADVKAIQKAPVGDEYLHMFELDELNTKAMKSILEREDFSQAYEYLKKAKAIALKSGDSELVRMFLVTCDHMGELAARMGNERFIGRVEYRAHQADGLFEENDDLWCLRQMIRMNRMFYEVVFKKQTDCVDTVREIVAGATRRHGELSNLCLGDGYEILLNAVDDVDELRKFRRAQRERLDSIGANEGGGHVLAGVYLLSALRIREETGGGPFTKDEVDDAYAIMLRYPRESGVREAFGEIFDQSTETAHPERYFAKEVVREEAARVLRDRGPVFMDDLLDEVGDYGGEATIPLPEMFDGIDYESMRNDEYVLSEMRSLGFLGPEPVGGYTIEQLKTATMLLFEESL